MRQTHSRYYRDIFTALSFFNLFILQMMIILKYKQIGNTFSVAINISITISLFCKHLQYFVHKLIILRYAPGMIRQVFS